MAKFLDINADRTLILEPREALQMPFKFKDWTRLQVGVAFDFVNSSYESYPDPINSTQISTETLNVTTPKDKLYFGIKDDSQVFPGFSNSVFAGYSTIGSQSYFTNSGVGTPRYLEIRNFGKVVSLPNTSVTEILGEIVRYATYGSSFYYGFILLDFNILNKGKSNQQIQISIYESSSSSEIPIQANDPPTYAKLKSMQSTFGLVGYDTFDLNLNSLPVKIPNSIFVYSPFLNKKLRIYSVLLTKLS